jgi:hypothetical protein
VTQHLTKSLIDLRFFRLAAQGNAELCFDHVECGFDVRAFVMALHESLGVVAVEVKHLFPDDRARATRFLKAVFCHAVALEGNVGLSVVVN